MSDNFCKAKYVNRNEFRVQYIVNYDVKHVWNCLSIPWCKAYYPWKIIRYCWNVEFSNFVLNIVRVEFAEVFGLKEKICFFLLFLIIFPVGPNCYCCRYIKDDGQGIKKSIAQARNNFDKRQYGKYSWGGRHFWQFAPPPSEGWINTEEVS